MTEPERRPPADMADKGVIMRIMFGAWVQQALYVAAKLDVADVLAEGPKPIEDLAKEVEADATALARFLRALVSVGVFDEPSPGTFALNGPARYLRSSTPDSHKYVVIMHGEEAYAACAEALYTARTGRPAFEKVYGKPYFQYLAENPGARSTFDAAMGRQTAVPLVAEECDFGTSGVVVDVGGGSGALLAHILRDRPTLRGVLYDLPMTRSEAETLIAEAGLTERIELVTGDALEEVPPGGDVYTLCRVLHDLDDDQASTVLGNIRRAGGSTSRLFVFDALLPDRPGFNPGRLADLGMLMVLGGRYRTEAELTDLVRRAGYRIVAVRKPAPGSDPRAESVVEAVPV